MAVSYPVTQVVPNYPLNYGIEHKTVISVFDGGQEARRRQWRFPKRTVGLSYSALTMSQLSTLWLFYQDRTGALGSFNFFEPDASPYNTTDNAHRDQYVARGSGSTATTYTFPGIANSTADTTVLRNGSALSSGYTLGAGTGDGGADLLTFTSNAPTSTDVITADFKGRLRFTGRFADDNLSRSQFEVQLFTQGIQIVEEKRSS